MQRLINETPVSAVILLSGTGALQMLIKWTTPALQYIILIGSAWLIVWKGYLAGEQFIKKIRAYREKKKKENAKDTKAE
ncbi:MAG: hypothetical protein PHN44_10850 [Candidatus Marinimicrobia bacterium]|nr:hypothetical protein [Candidatus Neomarinimicrobiota bacterium]MDD5539922.1 hypothetical protein [Candidatus Neomarinimicrobiota bacterium]